MTICCRLAVFVSAISVAYISIATGQTIVGHWTRTYANKGAGVFALKQSDSTFACLITNEICEFDASGNTVHAMATPFDAVALAFGPENLFVLTGNDATSGGTIAAMDRDGTILWDDTLGCTATYMIRTSDSGFLAGGNTSDGARLVKYDSAGARQWAHNYAPTATEHTYMINNIVEADWSGYFFCGGTSVVNVDTAGTIINSGSYGNSLNIQVYLGAEQYNLYKAHIRPGHFLVISGDKRQRIYETGRGEFIEEGSHVWSCNESYIMYPIFTNSSDLAYYKEFLITEKGELITAGSYEGQPYLNMFDSSMTRIYYMENAGAHTGAIPWCIAPIGGDRYVIMGSKGPDLWITKIGPPDETSTGRAAHVSLRDPENPGKHAQSFYMIDLRGRFAGFSKPNQGFGLDIYSGAEINNLSPGVYFMKTNCSRIHQRFVAPK